MWKLQKKEDVLDTFNEQLKKCQVEYFDFYLCHAMNRERMDWLEKYEVMPTLCRLKEEGKIRHLGFSFHDTPDVLEELLNRYQWDFVQIQLNYLDWELQDAKRQYELIAGKGLQAVIMEPVRGGMLASLCEEADQVFKEAEPEHSVASWALRFAMSLPRVLTVLSGMSNMDQVIDNVHTASEFEPLTDEQRGVIDAALEEFKKKEQDDSPAPAAVTVWIALPASIYRRFLRFTTIMPFPRIKTALNVLMRNCRSQSGRIAAWSAARA